MRTPSNVSDLKAVPAPLESVGPMRYLPGDKGCDAARGPKQEPRPSSWDAAIASARSVANSSDTGAWYRSRPLIENAFCQFKDLRCIATCHDNSPPTCCQLSHALQISLYGYH
jgi:hypothetical protein